MKSFIKFVFSVIVLMLILASVFYIVDKSRLKQGLEPIFSKKVNTANLEEGAEYTGFLYKMFTYKEKHEIVVKRTIIIFKLDKEKEQYSKLDKKQLNKTEKLSE